MADEAKDLGVISNNGTNPKAASTPHAEDPASPDASQGGPEVRILEEHVTHVAPPKSASVATDAAASPILEKPQVKPVAPTPPPIPPAATSAPVSSDVKVSPTKPVAPTPLSVPSIPAPTVRAQMSPPPAKGFDSIAEEVGLVLPTKGKSAPKTPPVSTPAPVLAKQALTPPMQKPVPPASPEPMPLQPSIGSPALGNDIANILAAVKLPERRLPAQIGESASPTVSGGGQKKFDTSIVGSVDSPPTPASPSVPSAPPASPEQGRNDSMPDTPKGAEKDPSSVTAVHTLKDDLQGVVHDQKISLVRAVSLEEDRRARTAADSGKTPGDAQRRSRTFGIMFVSLILLGLGAAAIFGVLFIMNKQASAPQIEMGNSILFAEQSVLLSLDAQSPEELRGQLVAGRLSGGGALGSVTRIIPVTAIMGADDTSQNRPATFKEFMAAIGAHPSDDILRALGNDFFLGIHAVDKSAPILIIPVVSHDRAFAAMLAWEDTLNADLAPLFTAVPVFTKNKDGLPVNRTYEDLVMRNYDVRALKDDTGTVQLYYSFPSQSVLVIAESPYSFPEILSRLQASRQL